MSTDEFIIYFILKNQDDELIMQLGVVVRCAMCSAHPFPISQHDGATIPSRAHRKNPGTHRTTSLILRPLAADSNRWLSFATSKSRKVQLNSYHYRPHVQSHLARRKYLTRNVCVMIISSQTIIEKYPHALDDGILDGPQEARKLCTISPEELEALAYIMLNIIPTFLKLQKCISSTDLVAHLYSCSTAVSSPYYDHNNDVLATSISLQLHIFFLFVSGSNLRLQEVGLKKKEKMRAKLINIISLLSN